VKGKSERVDRDASRELLELCDLAEVALHAVEMRGLLSDDRSVMALAVVRRWCEGGCTEDELDDAAEAASRAWSEAFGTPVACAYGAVDALCLAAQDELPVLDDEARDRVIDAVREQLVALGEARDAARAQVGEAYRAARRRRRR